jgi:hypothetical protein
MSRKQILLTLIVSLGSSGALQASPLDSPGIVYIDGLPCNSACQSYMAWSAQATSGRHREEHAPNVVVPAEEMERIEQPARPRVARQPAAVSRAAPRNGTAATNTKASNSKKTAAASPAPKPTRKEIPAATATVASEKATAGDRTPERKLERASRSEPGQAAPTAALQPAEAPKSEVKSEVASEVAAPPPARPEIAVPPATLEIAAPPATPEIAALPATVAAAPALAPRTIQQQVVEATGMADLVTAIGAGREPAGKSDNPETKPGEVSDTDKTASASPDDPDNLVALVLARPEISSLSDLNNKNIAIEEKQSASSGRVSAAFMAAGAAEVQFSEGQRGAIDRLISGEVPAAVLTLASREAAEWFPDIAGFRTFRVPLKERL